MRRFPVFIPRLVVFLTLPVSAFAQKVRIAAGNISSGNGQDYTQGHGLRIFQGVKPDIILIQEFNYLSNSTPDIRNFVNTAFGAGFSYFRESNTGSIPNGVISRYPILESGQWVSTVAERDYAWARIDLPGNREMLAVSVHLPTDDAKRPAEAGDLNNYIDSALRENLRAETKAIKYHYHFLKKWHFLHRHFYTQVATCHHHTIGYGNYIVDINYCFGLFNFCNGARSFIFILDYIF